MLFRSAEKIHELRASPTTVHRGFFDASLKPVLTIDSGDVVRLWTTTGNPRYFESLGVQPENIIYSDYTSQELYRAGASRGAIDPCFPAKIGISHVYNLIQEKHRKKPLDVIFFDPAKKAIDFAPGIVIPTKPFWGVIGVAPPPSMGRVPSGPPNVFGGNMDNHDLQPGTSLFLPIHADGALISIGDGHALIRSIG